MDTVITSFEHLNFDDEFFFHLPAVEMGVQGLRCKKIGIDRYIIQNVPEQDGQVRKVEKAERFWLVEKIIEG